MWDMWWKQVIAGVGVVILAVSTSGATDIIPIPELATWESDMLTFGKRQCRYFAEPGWDGGYGDTFYDAARVFYQMNVYTGDPSWSNCAQLAAIQYRTTQVASSGAVAWNNFSPGLRMHNQRTGDPLSKQTVHILATSAFASDSTVAGGPFNPDYGETYDLAREIAYAIKNHLDDEALGAPHRARLNELVNHAIKHYDQWFVSKQAQTKPIPSQYGPIGIQPFMVGLNMQSLIAYYEKYQDPRIPPLIRLATDELYTLAWRPAGGGGYYNSGIGTSSGDAEPGLNMLIAPAYAWMYAMTGETMYRDRGDEIFAAGVHYTHCASSPDSSCPGGVTKGAYLWSGKQFNQQYVWSFDYVKWRLSASVSPIATLPSVSASIGNAPTGVAASPSVSVSSENASSGQVGSKAIDGLVDGCTASNSCTPDHYTREWATLGQSAGAWIRLTWPSAVTISQVILHDRPNLDDHVLAGTLLFSDGSTIPVGALPNDGAGLSVSFSPKMVTWVQFRVDSAVGANIGLAEFEVSRTAIPLSRTASVSVSSENASSGQVGRKAIDGLVDGWPGDYTKEWATNGELAGAWIRLTWPSAVTVSQVILHDRPNLVDNVRAGTLVFSDGSTIPVGALPNDGAGLSVSFLPKTVTWVQFRVDSAVGTNIGLAEFEVSTTVNPLTTTASVSVSSENASLGQVGSKAIDGIVDGCTASNGCTPDHYTREWATLGQSAGAWIRLTWPSAVTVSQVILHDRPNLDDHVLAGTLLFSNGTSISVGTLPNNGTGLSVLIPPQTVTWVQFRVDSAVGTNIGLAEFEVYGPLP